MMTLTPLSQDTMFPTNGSITVSIANGESKAIAITGCPWAVQIELDSGAALLIEITAKDSKCISDTGIGASWETLDAAFITNEYVVCEYPVTGVRLSSSGGNTICTVISRGNV